MTTDSFKAAQVYQEASRLSSASVDRTAPDVSRLEEYIPLVRKLAYHIRGRLPNSVQIEDLLQSGMIGLLEAIKKYDPTKGASFETYAGIRVKGTILDEVRKNDWVPRSVYQNSRKITEAIKQVERTHGRDATETDVADYLKVSLKEYQQMLVDTNGTQIYGFEDLGIDDDCLTDEIVRKHLNPLEHTERERLSNALEKQMNRLPEKEKLVLALYYQEELNLKEIGAILNVSESRICQIHSQAASRLKSRLKEWDG